MITRYRAAAQKSEAGWCNSNLRRQLLRIIERAGVTPWPEPWQNLRSSRETELCESYPLHVVCSWIGNSPRVAGEHYLQVTPEHWEKAVQNPVQSDAARTRMALQRVMAGLSDEEILQRLTTNYCILPTAEWAVQDSNL